jgi:hypothetical protein
MWPLVDRFRETDHIGCDHSSSLTHVSQQYLGVASEFSGPLDLLILGAGDVLNKIDNGPAKLGLWNLHESFGELEPILRGEIV